jgi:hypothetical protein
MKKLDIRVIGKTEIDMNTLSEKAYAEVDSLFTSYSQMYDYKEYLWRNNNLILDPDGWYHTNHEELYKAHNELDMIEYKIIDIAKDGSNFKGINADKVRYYINKGINSKYYDLSFAVLFGYGYVTSCLESDIILSLVFGYLTAQHGLAYNIKRYTQKLVKGWA